MIQVKGIIVPVSWDENGNVAEVGIETFDEDFYLLETTSEFVRAKMLLREAVEISGSVVKAPGKKSIQVDRIAPIIKGETNRASEDECCG